MERSRRSVRRSGFADLVGVLERSGACTAHAALARSATPQEAQWWWDTIQGCASHQAREHLRWLGRNDLFFLLVYLLNRRHFITDERKTRWTFKRCWEVQADPDNHLDLWPRESYKSEIITYGLTIQDILNDPELTFGFFSHTRPMAKDFLTLIKREFETNELLKATYSDILWRNPKHESRIKSVSWSENEGITVKRKGNPKESTIEAWGLIDGQPTGKRFRRLIYDDVVARDNTSPIMTASTTDQFDNSLLLTASDPPVFRYIATFQEFGDTTTGLIKRGVGRLRLRGPFDELGRPAYLSDEKFAFFKQTLSPKVFGLQILLDPSQARDPTEVGFNQEWIDYWDMKDEPLTGMNRYIVVDPAGDSLDSNSYFAMWVVALGSDKRVRVCDLICDKYDLEERWEAVYQAVTKWDVLKVGYEKIGMQSDIEHFKYRQRELNQQFTITPLSGGITKDTRIGWLVPPFREHRILFPKGGIRRTLKNGMEVDMVRRFLEDEYLLWPYNPRQRDMLDALSRVFDPAFNIAWPRRYHATDGEYGQPRDGNGGVTSGSWMSA